jgi:hypothetical protein
MISSRNEHFFFNYSYINPWFSSLATHHPSTYARNGHVPSSSARRAYVFFVIYPISVLFPAN